MQSIEVCGRNNNFGIKEISNHQTPEGDKYIYPPFKSDFDPATVSSYSIYNRTVVVTNDGVALAIGDNTKSQISGSLPKQVLQTFHKIEFRDLRSNLCSATSSVCGNDYTLYIIHPEDEDSPKYLAYAHENLESENPVILNVGDVTPASIYGGYSDCAAITTVGSIVYIHDSLYQQISKNIDPVLLPENEKAVNIVCCYKFVIVLSISGRVYESKKEPILLFREIPELIGKKIISISGIYQHCFALSSDGIVYVRGDDAFDNGCLGLGKGTKSTDEFKEVTLLKKYIIDEVYAGSSHSLFRTKDGSILGCGDNTYGQILLSSGPCKEKIYKPTETIITKADSCVLGNYSTIIFKNFQPPMNPNLGIKKF